jgi:DNA-binding winged helix-turn-helix (wHTH) protein
VEDGTQAVETLRSDHYDLILFSGDVATGRPLAGYPDAPVGDVGRDPRPGLAQSERTSESAPRGQERQTSQPFGADGLVTSGPVTVDLNARTVYRNREEVSLSPVEYRLLAELAAHAGEVMGRLTLLDHVWGPGHAEKDTYLRTFVHRLRRKLEAEPSNPRILVTVGRRGYRFSSAAQLDGRRLKMFAHSPTLGLARGGRANPSVSVRRAGRRPT